MGLTFANRPRHRIWRLRNLVAVVIVVALGAGTFIFLRGSSGPPALPAADIDQFLTAWGAGDTGAMSAFIDAPPADLATSATSLVKSAPNSRARYTRTSLIRTKTGATATYRAHVDVAGFGPFDWNGTLDLTRVKIAKQTVWRIAWRPDDLYPGLQSGQHLVFQHTWPARASILASDGTFLAGSQDVVKIGLEPDRIATSLKQIKRLMRSLVGTDPAAIDTALKAPGVRPNYFVEIARVPDDARYRDELRPKLAPVPGVFFQHDKGVLAPVGALGAQLVGTVGEITAEQLRLLGAPYRVGDLVGLGGLQEAFEARLAGRPTGAIVVESTGSKGAITVVRTVKRFPGRNPEPVTVTIDPAVQQAAEAALAAVKLPSALVALDTATGQIRAVVSKPDNGFERALDGAYAPGSTFKVITSTALLEAGQSGSTAAPCPKVLTVDGKKFTNFEGEESGALDLAQAFAESCNNAFIGLAEHLPADALTKAAASFGFNVPWSLPVPSYGGTFPTPKDRAELAASAIGQGRLQASPLQMASVAAAVASGQWRAPVLTTQPAVAVKSARALDPEIAATLRGFMAGVVQPKGTAAGAGLPSGTFGKTGTAEFGNTNPPETHAWFIGYRNNLAFAVIVEGGGVGGRVAAPLAGQFLNALG